MLYINVFSIRSNIESLKQNCMSVHSYKNVLVAIVMCYKSPVSALPPL